MTEHRDPAIVGAVTSLARSSEEAPTFDELLAARGTVPPKQQRTWTVAVVVAAVALVMIGVASLLLGGSDGAVVPLPPVDATLTTVASTTTPEATTVDSTATPGANAIRDVAVSADGILYGSTDEGIATWDTETQEFLGMLPLAGLPGTSAGHIRSVDVQHVDVAADGTLFAAGTADRGGQDQGAPSTIGWVARFEGQHWSIPSATPDQAIDTTIPVIETVTDLAIGPRWPPGEEQAASGQASVWVTTGDRLVFFDGVMWWTYEIPAESANSVDVGPGGAVWLGTDQGEGPWEFRGGVFPWQRTFSAVPGEADITLPTMHTHQVAVAADGTVWMATRDGSGFIALTDGEVEVHTRSNGLLSNSGSIVVGTKHVAVLHDDGVSRYDGTSWSSIRLDLAHAVPDKAEMDANGVLWIPTTSGIARIEGASVSHLEVEDPADNAGSAATTWEGPIDPILLTLDPAEVPAELGVVSVTVTGHSWDDIWLIVCPGARGVVDPWLWQNRLDYPGACGEVSRDAGTHVNPTITAGRFEAVLEVTIDEQAIADGGVVITAGDIWVPLRGNVLLEVDVADR